jgi:FkbM family methyltransferase
MIRKFLIVMCVCVCCYGVLFFIFYPNHRPISPIKNDYDPVLLLTSEFLHLHNATIKHALLEAITEGVNIGRRAAPFLPAPTSMHTETIDNEVAKRIDKLLSDVLPLKEPVGDTLYSTTLDDVKKQISTFIQRRESYGNKGDFPAFKRLTGGGVFCDSKFPTLIGGVNQGQMTLEMIQQCPNLKVIGFEIQEDEFKVAKLKLAPYPSVELHNLGWGEREQSNLPISGVGEIGGIYETTGTGRESFKMQEAKATVTSMAKWCDDNEVVMTNYVLIDVEGYEPKVIRGMDLAKEKNQKRFSIFQFELGGTWAMNDPRHAKDWSQRIMAQYLVDFGYDLFMIGEDNWMKVQPSFFDEEGGHMWDEGYGRFIQGNLMCLHKTFAAKNVKELVFASANTV